MKPIVAFFIAQHERLFGYVVFRNEAVMPS